MANALGIDIGAVMRNAESIKTARINRERSQLALDADRKAAGQQDELTGLRRRAASGDTSALPEMVALQPQAAQQFMDAFEQMTAEEKELKRREIEVAGKAAAFVLNSSNPEQAYATMLSRLPPEQQERFPPQFDRVFVEAQLASFTELDSMVDRYFDQQDDRTKRREDEAADIRKTERDTQAKIKVEEVKAKIKAAGAGGSRTIKAADTNAIYRQTTDFFGGVLGPDGEVRLADPKDAAKLNNLSAEASNIWANGNMTHAEAVRQAADKLNYGLSKTPSEPAAEESNDPLGILGGG